MVSKKIILVDDETDFTDLTSTLLGFHGFDVQTLNDPREVSKQISDPADLYVLDLMMPHINGFELIQMLRTNEASRLKPIIVLSAKTLTDKERKFLFENQVRLLAKPFDPQNLIDQIRQMAGG